MKAMVFLIALLVLSGTVMAKENKTAANKSVENIVCCKTFGYDAGIYDAGMIETSIKYGWKQLSECRLPENFVGGGIQIVEDRYCIGIKEVGIKFEVKGLSNAIIKVKNDETRQHLEEVLNKIIEHRKEVLAKLEALTIRENANGEVEAEGKKEMKFLGRFKVKRSVKYTIDKEGNILKQPKWFDPWFKET